MNKLVYTICSLAILILSCIMTAAMLIFLGVLIFYLTYVTLELPDYTFLIYVIVACIIMIRLICMSIRGFKESKEWYENHINE